MDVDTRETAMDQSADADDDLSQQLPPDANETIYVKNLNERVKIPSTCCVGISCRSADLLSAVLKQSLEALFSTYGTVVSVTAHGNLRMRGQAFISFESKEPAAKAVKEVVGFPLYGKPMVSGIWSLMACTHGLCSNCSLPNPIQILLCERRTVRNLWRNSKKNG